MQTRNARFLRGAAICAAAVFVVLSQASAQTVIFKFNPPDGTQFTESLKRTKTTFQDKAPKQVDVTVAKIKTLINKTPKGYAMIVTPVSYEVTHDGKKVDRDALPELDRTLAGTTLTYELDKNGRFEGVTGFDEKISADLKSLATTRVKNDYNARIGNLIGRSVKPGQTWQTSNTVSLFSLPGSGSITLNQKSKYVGMQKYSGRNCAKIQTEYAADPAKLSASLQMVFSGVATSPKTTRPTSKVLSSSLSGKAERLIDPRTLLPCSEKTSRSFKISLESPKKVKSSGGFDETRESVFESLPK